MVNEEERWVWKVTSGKTEAHSVQSLDPPCTRKGDRREAVNARNALTESRLRKARVGRARPACFATNFRTFFYRLHIFDDCQDSRGTHRAGVRSPPLGDRPTRIRGPSSRSPNPRDVFHPREDRCPTASNPIIAMVRSPTQAPAKGVQSSRLNTV